MGGYNLGQYLPGHSLIHRLDPRGKILLTLTLSIFILRMGGWTGLLISVFLAAIYCFSRVPFRRWIESLKPMAWIFILIFLLHLFFTGGSPLFSFLFPLPWVTLEGFYQGTWVLWQFVLLVLSASLLTMTTRASELVMGLERLLRPLRLLGIPSHDLAMMISLALRFLPTFMEEIERIKIAQFARGADFRSGHPLQRARKVYFLALPVMIRLFRRADEIATAMEGRGYRRGSRTYLRELRWTRLDIGAGLLGVGFFALLYLL